MTEERKPHAPTDGAEEIERIAQEGQEALEKQLVEAADFSFLDEVTDFSALDEALNELTLLDLPALEDAADFTALDKALEETSPLLEAELEEATPGLYKALED